MDPEPRVKIAWLGEIKEHGLIASQSIDEGDVIFVEQPLLCAQYLYNRDFFPACSHCLKSLESPSVMLKRLAGMEEELNLPALPNYSCMPASSHIDEFLCHSCERERYCSEKCRRDAWEQYHELLCVRPSEYTSHPLIKLGEVWKSFHFPPESATINLLTRMIASVITELNHGTPIEKATSAFKEFKSQYRNQDIDVLHRFFEGKYDDKITEMQRLVKEALYDPRIDDLFTENGFRKLLSIIALNGQGIGTSSLEHYQRLLIESDSDEYAMVMDQLETLDPLIEEISGEFTHSEGSGLYRLHSKINHSCVPNAIVQFPDNSSKLEVVAIRPIEEGEEICISYLELEEDDDEDESNNGQDGSSCSVDAMASRKEELRNFYLFDCTCPSCSESVGK